MVLANDGSVVEIAGFVSGLLSRVDIPFAYRASTPLDLTSTIGEHWRLAVFELQGGKVILGISDLNQVPNADDMLVSTSHAFGSSLQEALKVEPRQIDVNIDYAVVANDGTLKYAIGGVPLRVVSGGVNVHSNERTSQHLVLDRRAYQVVAQSINDRSGHPVGTMIAVRNIDAELQTLHQQLFFNVVVTGFAFILTLLLFALYALRAVREKTKEGFVQLSDALTRGEGQEVEFKEMLPSHRERADGEKDGLRRFATALAAFANSNAGNVFVGVNDRGEVRGLEARTAKERERALEVVKNLILQYISPTITPEVTWIDHDGKTVMHIYVPRGDQPIYYVGGAIYVRHLASVQTARADLVESMVKRFYGTHRGFGGLTSR